MAIRSWTAQFTDHQPDRTWAVGPPWEEIILAPSPRPEGLSHVRLRDEWMLVGGSGMPELEEPYPGQRVYELIDIIGRVGDTHGMTHDIATYRPKEV
jgi:hypothetical protein